MKKVFLHQYTGGQSHGYLRQLRAYHSDGKLEKVVTLGKGGKEEKTVLAFFPQHVQDIISNAVLAGEGLIIND